jgi:hypothetical protein
LTKQLLLGTFELLLALTETMSAGKTFKSKTVAGGNVSEAIEDERLSSANESSIAAGKDDGHESEKEGDEKSASFEEGDESEEAGVIQQSRSFDGESRSDKRLAAALSLDEVSEPVVAHFACIAFANPSMF